MEFTGQAFEEMQEQNIRLMQQLREKDDANLKLMSEVNRIPYLNRCSIHSRPSSCFLKMSKFEFLAPLPKYWFLLERFIFFVKKRVNHSSGGC